MNSIYIYEGEFLKGDKGFDMIRAAAYRHCMENGIEFDPARAKITRDEKGKPYFEDIALEFSLSHTGQLWMCLFSDKVCGLDVQEVRDCDHEKIAERYFFDDEKEKVNQGGLETFFDIWVRKEAYCKMTGAGMFGNMPSVLADRGQYNGRSYCFRDIEVSDRIRCAICSEDTMEVEMRLLG